MVLVFLVLLGFLALVLAGVGGFLAVASRKETMTVENPTAGYRQPALTKTVRHISIWQRLKEMPPSTAAIIVALAVLFSVDIAAIVCSESVADAWRAVAPRFDEVPAGYRGIIVDRYGNQADEDVLEPGRHFVWSQEGIARVSCWPSAIASETFEPTAQTVDGHRIGLRVIGQARFACDDGAVRRVVEDRRGEEALPHDAWYDYVVPTVRSAFYGMIDTRSAEEVCRDRNMITEALVRYVQSLMQVEIDIQSVELILPDDLCDTGQTAQPTFSWSELPSLDGWSATAEGNWFTYRHRESISYVSVMPMSTDRGTPEDLVREIQSESDRTYAGRLLESSLIRGASGDLVYIRSVQSDGGIMYDFSTVMESSRPGVNVLVFGLCYEASCIAMLDGMSRVIAALRPADPD